MKRTVQLIDTTLRDGAQAPNVIFSRKEKIHIVNMLSDAGIRLFEAGIPAMSDQECQDIEQLRIQFPHCIFIGWCRASTNDIQKAHLCGCEAVHLTFPSSPLHMSIIGTNENEVLDNIEKLTAYAKKYIACVSIGAQDASRASMDFLLKFVNRAHLSGCSHIRIADTVGILSPVRTIQLISLLNKENPGFPIEFHGHNDLGMATANTITALEAGAELASVTVNGIGERAGNAALEDVVMSIKCATDLNISFDFSKLNSICKKVAAFSKIPIPDSKSVTGKIIFTHESGIHCHGQIKNRSAYEPYNPQLTGHSESDFKAGSSSGRTGIDSILKSKGIAITAENLKKFTNAVKVYSLQNKRSLNAEETLLLYKNFIDKE